MKADDLFRALGDVDPQYVEGLLAEKKNEIRRDSATAEEKTVIPLKPVRRKKIWLSAAVTIVAVVSGVSLLSVMLLRGFSVPNAPSSSLGNAAEEDVPAWYIPGQLTVQTVTYTEYNEVAFSAGDLHLRAEPMKQAQRYNQTIPFAPKAEMLSAENAAWLLLEDAATVPGHEKCRGFLYHTETQKVICLTHLLTGRLPALGSGAQLHVVSFNARNQRCILTVRDPDTEQPGEAYFFNWETNELKPLPELIAQNAVQMDLEMMVSCDQRYVLAMDSFTQGQPAGLYCIDTQQDMPTAQLICTYENFNEKLYAKLKFSPRGQYLVYVDPEHEETASKDKYNWIMQCLDSEDSWKGCGGVVRFVQEEKAVVVDLGNGGAVYDTATGEDITDTCMLEDWEKESVNVIVHAERTYINMEIYTKSVFTGEMQMRKTNVSALCTRGSVLYTYTDGDKAVECLSLDTGETFRAPISPEYEEQVNALRDKYKIIHKLDISEDGTKLLLCFTCVPLPTAM